MTDQNPITPPPELVASLRNSAPHGIRDAGVTREIWLIHNAFAAGADQELEACVEWMWTQAGFGDIGNFPEKLQADRRPKPPSLKEQALEVFEALIHGDESGLDVGVIRRALEQLDD